MENKDKTQEIPQQTQVFVDSNKMLQGMSLVFSGAMRILESLGPNIIVNADKILPTLTMGNQPNAAIVNNTEIVNPTNANEHIHSSNETLPIEMQAEEKRVSESENMISSVTIDEITKVILRKIKQNKANEEKIGNLVSNFGVARVKELTPDKYEAFLSDLASI